MRTRVRRERKQRVDSFSEERLHKLRFAAIKYACDQGFQSESHDFGSFVMVNVMTGNLITLKYQWADYMEATFGNLKSEKGTAKSEGIITQSYIGEDAEAGEVQVGIEDKTLEKRWLIDFADEMKLRGQDRIIFILLVHEGMTMKQIGDAIGRSESWICNKWEVIRARIEKKIEKSPTVATHK